MGNLVYHNRGVIPGNDKTFLFVEDDKGDLPEGFFDDPIQDAKARGIEYKVGTDKRTDQRIMLSRFDTND